MSYDGLGGVKVAIAVASGYLQCTMYDIYTETETGRARSLARSGDQKKKKKKEKQNENKICTMKRS